MILLGEEPREKRIPVYIYEADAELRARIVDYIESVTMKERLDMHIIVSKGDPTELLWISRKKNESGIYILDATFTNFLQLADTIKKARPHSLILFTASSLEVDYLEIDAWDYVMKHDYQKMRLWLVECVSIIKRAKNT